MNNRILFGELETWTRRHSSSAIDEGWSLFECLGSINGPVQVQAIMDHSELPVNATQLNNDIEAFNIVATGTLPHHIAARDIVRRFNSLEWALLIKHGATE